MPFNSRLIYQPSFNIYGCFCIPGTIPRWSYIFRRCKIRDIAITRWALSSQSIMHTKRLVRVTTIDRWQHFCLVGHLVPLMMLLSPLLLSIALPLVFTLGPLRVVAVISKVLFSLYRIVAWPPAAKLLPCGCNIVIKNTTNEKSKWIVTMIWCPQATSVYLSQCWPSCVSPSGPTRPQWGVRIKWFSYVKVPVKIYVA